MIVPERGEEDVDPDIEYRSTTSVGEAFGRQYCTQQVSGFVNQCASCLKNQQRQLIGPEAEMHDCVYDRLRIIVEGGDHVHTLKIRALECIRGAEATSHIDVFYLYAGSVCRCLRQLAHLLRGYAVGTGGKHIGADMAVKTFQIEVLLGNDFHDGIPGLPRFIVESKPVPLWINARVHIHTDGHTCSFFGSFQKLYQRVQLVEMIDMNQ